MEFLRELNIRKHYCLFKHIKRCHFSRALFTRNSVADPERFIPGPDPTPNF